MPEYNVLAHKVFLRQLDLIPVKITEDSIRPLRKCSDVCQSDGGCCGFFEGVALDGDEPCATCSKRGEDA